MSLSPASGNDRIRKQAYYTDERRNKDEPPPVPDIVHSVLGHLLLARYQSIVYFTYCHIGLTIGLLGFT